MLNGELMNTAIIGLGSNINPAYNIEKARALLSQKYTIRGQSDFIKTKPIGFPDQADFINGAVFIETTQDQPELRTALKEIETTLGRTKSQNKFGPRTIDLDILIFNDKVVHQDFYTRDFIPKLVLALKPNLKIDHR